MWITSKYTPNQARYNAHLYNQKPLLIVEGPAGCGKTMLACNAARKRMDDPDDKLDRLILTRPLVTVNNESIGYLPGTVDAKMQPWVDTFSVYLDDSAMRIDSCFVPLGFIRGTTWDNSLIIADEMQNSTKQQMLTLLTRIGFNSKLIVIGDCTQSDLDSPDNGLADLKDRVYENEQLVAEAEVFIDVIRMNASDIKRSPFVRYVTQMYTDT
jgi:phosphate starvation-inducible PhoH-like protein